MVDDDQTEKCQINKKYYQKEKRFYKSSWEVSDCYEGIKTNNS